MSYRTWKSPDWGNGDRRANKIHMGDIDTARELRKSATHPGETARISLNDRGPEEG